MVEFVLHFFVYVSFKIGEITHSTFFQIIFCLFLILDYQGAECVLTAIPFYTLIHPSILVIFEGIMPLNNEYLQSQFGEGSWIRMTSKLAAPTNEARQQKDSS